MLKLGYIAISILVGPALFTMEKLSESRRETVKKMSDVRLTNKLLQLGLTLEQLEAMDRPGMLNAYAELILAGKDKPPATAVATPVAAPSGMAMMVADPEMQKQILQLEMAKLEEARREREDRQRKEELAREQDMARLEQQMRLDMERLDWERRVKAEELELRKHELARQQEKDKLEAERLGAIVSKVKLYGDAFRNAAFRMGNEPMDALPFFEHCESF